MTGQRYLTEDHETIRSWAEERDGSPAAVQGTGAGEDPGILRIDFPGYSGDRSLERISWDEWFEKFDDDDLVLLYQETTSNGEKSNFSELLRSETADEAAETAEWR